MVTLIVSLLGSSMNITETFSVVRSSRSNRVISPPHPGQNLQPSKPPFTTTRNLHSEHVSVSLVPSIQNFITTVFDPSCISIFPRLWRSACEHVSPIVERFGRADSRL